MRRLERDREREREWSRRRSCKTTKKKKKEQPERGKRCKLSAARRGNAVFLSFPGINAAKLNDRSPSERKRRKLPLPASFGTISFVFTAGSCRRSISSIIGLVAITLVTITLVPTRHLNATRSLNASGELWRKISSIARQIFPTANNFDPPPPPLFRRRRMQCFVILLN